MFDPHALTRAASAVVVVVAAFGIVQPARVRRREERDALFVVRGGYDARAEHGSRALDRDVDERFRVGRRSFGPIGRRRREALAVGDARGRRAEHGGGRVDEKHEGLAVRLRKGGGTGNQRLETERLAPRAEMMLAGSRRDVRGGGFRVCRGRVTPATSRGRTSGRNSSSSSSSSSWMLRHELAIVVFSRVVGLRSRPALGTLILVNCDG